MWETLYEYRHATTDYEGWGAFAAAVVVFALSFYVGSRRHFQKMASSSPDTPWEIFILGRWLMRGFCLLLLASGCNSLTHHASFTRQLETQEPHVVEGSLAKMRLHERGRAGSLVSLEIKGETFYVAAKKLGPNPTAPPEAGGVFREGDHLRISHMSGTVLKIERRRKSYAATWQPAQTAISCTRSSDG